MKIVRFAPSAFIFVIALAITGFAQVPAQPAAPIKIMFIDTSAFEDTGGINRIINANAALAKEIEPARAEIRGMIARHDALVKDLQALEPQVRTATGVQRDNLAKQFTTKNDEAESLETQIKRKQEDGKALFERREGEMINPVLQDIGRAMQDFAKQRGYSVIFDVSKLAQTMLVFDTTKADATKDFIAFYNSRLAPAAKP